MKRFTKQVKVTSPQEARLVMAMLQEVTGLQIHSDNITPEQFAKEFGAVKKVGPIGGVLTGWYYDDDGEGISIGEFMKIAPEFMVDRSVTVKLNEEYSAIIDPKQTKVGCQTFENSKILEVAEAIKKLS